MEVRNLRLIKNKDGHGTVNYKICLPTKWVNFLELYKENEVVVYLENNNIVIKSKGDFKMDEIIKELKEELLNKEMSLLEMDNGAERITGSTTSLFDAENDCMEQTSCAYYIDTDKNIVLDFEIVKKEEDNKDTIIKITNIWED